MMKYTPRVRSDSAPITSAKSPEITTAAGHAIHALSMPSAIMMPTT